MSETRLNIYKIPIEGDEVFVEVKPNSISFHDNPPLPQRIFFLCWAIPTVLLLCAFLLVIGIMAWHFWQAPTMLIAMLVLGFTGGAFIVALGLLWMVSLTLPHHACFHCDDGVISYAAKNGLFRCAKTMTPDDFVCIEHVYSRGDYGVVLSLNRHYSLLNVFSAKQVLRPLIVGSRQKAMALSKQIEFQLKEYLPGLKVRNFCAEKLTTSR